MKQRRLLTVVMSVLVVLSLTISPAFAAQKQPVAVGETAPEERFNLFESVHPSAEKAADPTGVSGILASAGILGPQESAQITEAADPAEQGFQILNRSLDKCLQETGQTWKEWYAASQRSRKEGTLAPVSLQDLRSADPNATVFSGEDGIYMITGESLPLKAADMDGAFYTAYQMLSLLGRDADTDLTLRSVISEGNAQTGMEHIYVFQEIRNGETVLGSTLRLVTDEGGQVKAVFSSLFTGEPSRQEALAEEIFADDANAEGANSEETVSEDEAGQALELIDAEAAEQIVQTYLKDTGIVSTLLPDFTSRIIVMPEEDDNDESYMMSEEELPEILLWVVYTESPDGSYLAHYLSADGIYLYHQKVKVPGDEAGQSGSDTSYFFDGLEAAEYTGEVTYLNGETKSVTIPVMKDPATGTYYLGDVQRRIAFGEFYDYVYNDESLVLVSSDDNTGWNESDLITFETFLKVYDYYASLGWISGDGLGTPVLILRDMKLENGAPLDNAAFGAIYKDWAIFAYDNSGINFQEALDVWAHEFTHALTSTLQGYMLYQNDQGAINESMSDIMGNLFEILIENENDHFWKVGEDTTQTVRAMMDPHAFGQPEYVWDLYYGTATSKPNDINDRGGVHGNSAILNLLAARLCGEYGMPAGIARDFWLRLASMLTPMTDLPQIADTLEWVIQTSETEQWSGAISQLIEAGQFRRVNAPSVLEAGRKMVILELPDTPAMRDEHWVLIAFQLGDLSDILNRLVGEFLSADSFGGESSTEEAATEEAATGDADGMLSELLRQYTSWTNGEDQTIYMQIEDQPTLYALVNIDPDTMYPLGLAVYMNGTWNNFIDQLGELTLAGTEDFEQYSDEEALEAVMNALVPIIEKMFPDLFGTEQGPEPVIEGTNMILPSDGLEQIELLEPEEAALIG